MLDRISNLPNDVAQHILSYLPIHEAVRTSVLSSNWRFKWAMLPSLVFDNQLDDRSRRHIESVVDQVLLLHLGPVDTFKLSMREHISNSAISQWILHLSRNSIKQLILKSWNGNHASGRASPISSLLFSCRDLTHLELYNFMLKPPSTFKGFGMLKSLAIKKVTLVQHDLEKIIVLCPLLERMTLLDLEGITHLRIEAPNLQFLKLRGDLKDVQLTNTLNLVHVSIDRNRAQGSSKLLKCFVKLPRIERLEIEGYFLACDVGSLPEEPCLSLNFLSLSIGLGNVDEILTAMSLLRSSLALRELEISIRQENEAANAGETTYWLNDNQNWEFTQLRRVKITGFSGVKAEVDLITFLSKSSPALRELEILFRENTNKITRSDYAAMGNCPFTQLRVMKVTGFYGVEDEVGFLRFLLSSSPLLERITLQPASAQVSWEVTKLLAEFKCNSAHAELNFLDPLSDSDDYSNDEGNDSYSD